MSSPTLAEVAAAAGVSVATASRALSGRGDLSAATRQRVRSSAAALGYTRERSRGGRPHATAQVFDLVLGGFHNPWADEVAAGAHVAATARGFDLTLTSERDAPGDDWPVRIRRRGSAGVILGLIAPTTPQIALVRSIGVPVVVLDPPSESTHDLPSVRTTDIAGAAAAARHLASRGATRFAVINGSPPFRYGRARHAGFTAELAQHLPHAQIDVVSSAWRGAAARDAVVPVLRSLAPDDRLGLFAISDELAAGAYAAAAVTGHRIPEDILIVGFDDVRGARWLTPPLRTVRQPIREMAAAAVDMLADAVDGACLPAAPTILRTELVVRGST
ncbi:substrate-binding domain-containing protein [Microbacterium sp. C7(2022)]|uniref:substrate-binding domain-containing protein n=1 Tax=Microbacterium sp. C7(2022) TaxID=2992759 RepID=UPI00237C14DC|nr:substrate-binding domain-containing protein [Microbacterium sp. C7(2022)]MDE0545225.1 substrate-binding domain-containing protein [Microbacterium sp. C7(2022)]